MGIWCYFISYPRESGPATPGVMTYHSLKLYHQLVGTEKFVHQKILPPGCLKLTINRSQILGGGENIFSSQNRLFGGWRSPHPSSQISVPMVYLDKGSFPIYVFRVFMWPVTHPIWWCSWMKQVFRGGWNLHSSSSPAHSFSRSAVDARLTLLQIRKCLLYSNSSKCDRRLHYHQRLQNVPK